MSIGKQVSNGVYNQGKNTIYDCGNSRMTPGNRIINIPWPLDGPEHDNDVVSKDYIDWLLR